MKKLANKSTNKYRRCPNCPHHNQNQQKCCCQRGSTARKPRPMTSRNKRQPSTIDHSSVVNTTMPTIIAQFSALRTQNNHLKRQLLNVSTFLKDEPIVTSPNDSSLNEKLFLSNKNLKQALLEIDSLSKANKELCERNSRLGEQNQGLKIQLREVQDYLQRYKKKCKRMTKDHEVLATKEQTERLLQNNQELQDEVSSLRQELRCLRYQNKNYNMMGVLSPQWVAHTGYKVRPNDVPTKCEEEYSRQQVEMWKKSLSQTINVLKNEGSHFSSTSEEMPPMASLQGLIQKLLESYSESILTHFQLLMKETNRKLNNYQKKFNNLVSKLQNFKMVFHNKNLKRRLQPGMSVMKTQRTPLSTLSNRLHY